MMLQKVYVNKLLICILYRTLHDYWTCKIDLFWVSCMFLWLAFWAKSEDALEEVDTPEVAKTVLVGVPNTLAKKLVSWK